MSRLATRIILYFLGVLLVFPCHMQGEDYCLRRCTDFNSTDCVVQSSATLSWKVNDTVIVSELNETNLNVNTRLYPINNGKLRGNLTAFNVCYPLVITCMEGPRELWSQAIRVADSCDMPNEVDFFNSTTNSTTEPQPHDETNIAAAVVVPIIIIVALGIILLCWCLKRRERSNPSTSSSLPLPSSPLPGGDKNHGDSDVPSGLQHSELVAPKETSESTIARRTAVSFREQPKSNISRDDVRIDFELGADPVCKPDVKLQSGTVENGSLQDIEVVVEQCSDMNGLTPVWYDGTKIWVNNIPSPESRTYYNIMPPQIISSQEREEAQLLEAQ